MPTIDPDEILQCMNCRGRYRAGNYVAVEGVDTLQCLCNTCNETMVAQNADSDDAGMTIL